MAGKEITDLTIANDFESGDLISIRKNAQLEDKALSFDNLLKSIGNTAVDGFVSDSEEANKIKIDSANGVEVDRYYDGMKVSFVSPIASTGLVQLKIGALAYKDLYVHKTQDSVVLQLNDYVEAVYIANKFYQVNRTDYVYTNDYKVILVDIDASELFTTIYLTSAFGVTKTSYYEGMTAQFLCTADTKGLSRIRIDGLVPKDVLENSGDYLDVIYTPLYSGQIVRLIYDGQSFIKDRFSKDDPKIEYLMELGENNSNPDSVIPPQDIVPISNKSLFKVGTGQMFTNFADALKAIFNEYGLDGKKKGGQQEVTIEVTSILTTPTQSIYFENDASWIILKSSYNNKTIKFTGYGSNIAYCLFYFNHNCFKIESGTTIDLTQVSINDNLNGAGFIRTLAGRSSLYLDNITILAAPNSSWGVFYFQQQPSGSLENCVITGGGSTLSFYGVYIEHNQSNSVFNILNTTITGVYVPLYLYNADLYIKNSAFTRHDLTETTIYFDNQNSKQLIKVNQLYSRAKSNLAPNTSTAYSQYLVTGSQEIQGL